MNEEKVSAARDAALIALEAAKKEGLPDSSVQIAQAMAIGTVAAREERNRR